MAARLGDHLLDVIEPALAVVRKHHGVDARNGGFVVAEQRGENFVVGVVFKIRAQHLLLARDDAKLHCGREFVVDVKHRADAGVFQ